MYKYQIGQLVILKAGMADAETRCRMGELGSPNHFLILERDAQECPGGTQLHYTLSGTRKLSALEIELALPSEWDPEAMARLANETWAKVRSRPDWARSATKAGDQ